MKRKKERKRIKSEQFDTNNNPTSFQFRAVSGECNNLMTMKITYFTQTYIKYLLQSNFLAKLCYKSYK